MTYWEIALVMCIDTYFITIYYYHMLDVAVTGGIKKKWITKWGIIMIRIKFKKTNKKKASIRTLIRYLTSVPSFGNQLVPNFFVHYALLCTLHTISNWPNNSKNTCIHPAPSLPSHPFHWFPNFLPSFLSPPPSSDYCSVYQSFERLTHQATREATVTLSG